MRIRETENTKKWILLPVAVRAVLCAAAEATKEKEQKKEKMETQKSHTVFEFSFNYVLKM